MRSVGALMLVAVTACAAIPSESSPRMCNVEVLTDLVGRTATSELGSTALQRAGARALRWIRPGDVVTMDYREDRLNVHLDGQNRIARFVCG